MNRLMRIAISIVNVMVLIGLVVGLSTALVVSVGNVAGCNLHGVGSERTDQSKRDAGIKGNGNEINQNNNDVNIYYALIGLLGIDALTLLYSKIEAARQAKKHGYVKQRAKRLTGVDLK